MRVCTQASTTLRLGTVAILRVVSLAAQAAASQCMHTGLRKATGLFCAGCAAQPWCSQVVRFLHLGGLRDLSNPWPGRRRRQD